MTHSFNKKKLSSNDRRWLLVGQKMSAGSKLTKLQLQGLKLQSFNI